MTQQRIIPKEKAVFWMDGNGVWHNEHGRIQHPKIVSYFNRSIQKDKDGYHLFQVIDGIEEKVYFPCQETALFVTDLKVSSTIELALNNTQKMILDPETLFTRNDALYLETGDHLVKFSERALLKLSSMITAQGEDLLLTLHGKTLPIKSR